MLKAFPILFLSVVLLSGCSDIQKKWDTCLEDPKCRQSLEVQKVQKTHNTNKPITTKKANTDHAKHTKEKRSHI